MRAFARCLGVLTISAYAVLSVAGTARAQSALDFAPGATADANDAYVTFGATSALGLTTFTLETWFRRDGTGVANTTGSGGIPSMIPLISKGAPQSDGASCPTGDGRCDANYVLGISTAGNVLAADFEDKATGLNHPISGITPILTGTWYHAAATYDGTTWRLYLNGQLEAELVVGAFTPRDDSLQHAGLATMLTTTGAALGFFDGVLDEPRIWNTARTAAQIRATMNVQNPSDAALVARWGLDEGSGTAVADSAGAAQNGTVTAINYAWVTGAPFDIAPCADASNTSLLSFDGSNDYVTFGNPAALKLATFTVETWFYRSGTGVIQTTGTGGIANFIPLVTKGSGEGETPANINENYLLGIDNATNRIAGDYEEPTGPNHPLIGTTTLSNNAWYHAAITYDGTTFRIYLDGVLENSVVAAGPASTSDQHVALAAMLPTSGSPGAGRFAGILDEVRIWNVARTGPQIAADRFNQLLSGSGLVARWGLTEGTGTTTTDSVSSIVGTLTSGPSWIASNNWFGTSTACDDDLFCNGDDTCNGGAGGLRCAIHDGDPCVGGSECNDSCNEAADNCAETAGTPCGSPSNTVCDDPDTCDGAGACDDNNEPNTTVCIPDAGECDVADYCDGAGACPANTFEPGGTACGSPGNTDCDNPDTCNGAGACSDNNEPSSVQCRADAGECDVAENCDGAGNCPANGFEPSGTPCGSASNTVCDDPDTCDGAGACELNLEPATTVCRPDAGDCDVEELCDGVGACPSDVLEDDGTPCDDGEYCTVPDVCTAGVCDGAPRDCSASGSACRVGTCNETTDACEGPAKPNNTLCDDDNDCTTEDKCTDGECSGQPDDLACLDHFSCYKSKTTLGFAPVAGITLVDAFWASTAEAKKPKWLCAPAAKNAPSSTAPSHPDHLESYQIKPAAKFAGATGVQLQDDLGTTTVTLTKPANLLVPTAKSLVSAPAVPSAPIVDNFQCYKVKVTSSSASLPQIGVTVEDQFGEQTAELRKLKYACVPVNRGGTEAGAETHTGYLTCYQQKSLPKFVKQTPVYTANQLGSETMDVIKPFVLCMPAARVP